jgi:hypothetical protein
MKLRSACVGLVIAGAVPAWVAAGESAASVDLSGRWRLNLSLSSANAAAAPSATTAPPQKKSDEPAGKADGKAEAAKDVPVVELAITQTEAAIAVDEKPGAPRQYYPNGKTYKADDGQSDIRSQWRDGRLLFEKKTRQGWRLTETWEVAPDRNRLTVETRVEGGGRPKALVKRVYDRIVEAKP